MKYLVTGAAGFIGFHLCQSLLQTGKSVRGIDDINSYYDIKLKKERLKNLNKSKKFKFKKLDISNFNNLKKTFSLFKPDVVIHLAAQAGVRYSIKNPHAYTKSNLVGFANILECSRLFNIKHLIFASSSSVYGNTKNIPFKEDENLNSPISYYAATKLSNEVMAYSYSHLYRIPITGLRFFTVYGPWGRPDMALSIFTEAIKNNKKLKIFNNGNMLRDFTYIDDVINAVKKIINKKPKYIKKNNSSSFRILNIGNNKPIKLNSYVNLIEKQLQKKGNKVPYKMQKGDVKQTYASLKKIKKLIKYSPKTSISIGIRKFVTWHNEYYKK